MSTEGRRGKETDKKFGMLTSSNRPFFAFLGPIFPLNAQSLPRSPEQRTANSERKKWRRHSETETKRRRQRRWGHLQSENKNFIIRFVSCSPLRSRSPALVVRNAKRNLNYSEYTFCNVKQRFVRCSRLRNDFCSHFFIAALSNSARD